MAVDLPSARLLGAVMVVIIVVWGLSAPVTKLITAPPLIAVSLRFWLTVPVLCALATRTRERSGELLGLTAVAGLLFGANQALAFIALKHASVAVLSMILALQPAVVLIVGGPLLGERPSRMHVLFTVGGTIGVSIVVLGGDPSVRGDLFGIAMSAASMLTFVGYYVINRHVRTVTDMSASEWMARVTLFAALAVTPVAMSTSPWSDVRQLGSADWLYVAFMAGAVGVVGHTTMAWIHRFLPAARSSIVFLAMNVVAITVAWPLHDEPVSLVQVAGGVLVLGATAAVMSGRTSLRRARPSTSDDDTQFAVPPTTLL